MLNRNSESRHPCLVPELIGKALSFCQLSIMLTVGLSYMTIIMLRNAPFMSTLLSVFYHKWMLYHIKSIFCIYWYNLVILSFLFFMWCIMFIDLLILYHCCIPVMNPTWSWCMIFLMYCWMQFDNILLRMLTSMFITQISLKFSFFLVSLSGFGIRMMVAA